MREIGDIKDHTSIYIWTGNNADEQTALRFYLYLLREKPNEIYPMNATEEEWAIFHTGSVIGGILGEMDAYIDFYFLEY